MTRETSIGNRSHAANFLATQPLLPRLDARRPSISPVPAVHRDESSITDPPPSTHVVQETFLLPPPPLPPSHESRRVGTFFFSFFSNAHRSVRDLEERGTLDENRYVDEEKFYKGMMKQVRTVEMPELSDAQIQAARERRRQSRFADEVRRESALDGGAGTRVVQPMCKRTSHGASPLSRPVSHPKTREVGTRFQTL